MVEGIEVRVTTMDESHRWSGSKVVQREWKNVRERQERITRD